MNESKIEITHRLRREGRWDEASRFKDETITQLRSEGLKRSEAQETAWQAMEENFPPIAGMQASALTEASWGDLMDIPANSPESFITDATWVYERLAVTGIKPSDAISPGAWSLLQWAKSNPDRFFEQIMPKLFIARQKGHEPAQTETFDFCDDLRGYPDTCIEFLRRFSCERKRANSSTL